MANTRAALGGRTSITAVVATAVAISFAISGCSASHPQTGTAPPAATRQRWAPQDGDVAAGFGSIWALACCDRNVGRSWVDQLNPRTGALIHRIAVRTPTSWIAAGAGYVWVAGANPGGGGASTITAIDPRTGDIHTQRYSQPHTAPYSIAFADGYAWVTEPEVNQVWRLGPGLGHGLASGIEYSPVAVTGEPWTIATTGDGKLWVQEAEADKLARIDPQTMKVTTAVSWPGELFAASSGGIGGLWATYKAHTLLELAPSSLQGCSACAQVDDTQVRGQIRDLVATSRGLFAWVAIPGGGDRTDFWSTADLGGSSAKPTASLPGGGSIAPDGDGVVIGTGSYGLIHWVPSG